MMKKTTSFIAALFLLACGQQLHAQAFNWHFNSDRGEIWSVNNDNNPDGEDFIWLMGQNSWSNGSNTERMRLSKNGLFVRNNLYLMTSNQVKNILLTHDGNVASLRAGGATNGFSLLVGNGSTTSMVALPGSGGANNISDGQTYIEGMRILPNGNVGLGTSTPWAKLDVAGDFRSRTAVFMSPLSGGEGDYIRNLKQASSDNNGLALFTNYNQRMMITKDGNVGIGTTNPDKGILHIKGSFHVETNDNYQVFHVSATKALVFVGKTAYSKYLNAQANGVINQNNYSMWVSEGIVSEDYAVANVSTWSDYVFDKNYVLPSLEKLEQYIQQYKHLPAIPSEEEVKKNGYSLTKLNNSFLKTMEELTLYTIDQHKKTTALEEQVNNQQAQIDKLAQELAALKAMIQAAKN